MQKMDRRLDNIEKPVLLQREIVTKSQEVQEDEDTAVAILASVVVLILLGIGFIVDGV